MTEPATDLRESTIIYIKTMPRWKTALVIGATAMFLVAMVALLFEEPPPPGGETNRSLAAGQETQEVVEPVSWSEVFFRFGFSFFIGFALGYACRQFSRFVMVLVGALSFMLFVLSFYGFIEVRWDALDQAFTRLGQAVTGQAGPFKSFVTSGLPSAGLGGLGIFAGFKNNR